MRTRTARWLRRSRNSGPIRDIIAIAERPDGTRVAFRPYPTPLFDPSGAFTGAVNMLIDVTDEQSEALHEQAERCRRLADAIYDREINEVLGDMAEGSTDRRASCAEGLSSGWSIAALDLDRRHFHDRVGPRSDADLRLVEPGEDVAAHRVLDLPDAVVRARGTAP